MKLGTPEQKNHYENALNATKNLNNKALKFIEFTQINDGREMPAELYLTMEEYDEALNALKRLAISLDEYEQNELNGFCANIEEYRANFEFAVNQLHDEPDVINWLHNTFNQVINWLDNKREQIFTEEALMENQAAENDQIKVNQARAFLNDQSANSSTESSQKDSQSKEGFFSRAKKLLFSDETNEQGQTPTNEQARFISEKTPYQNAPDNIQKRFNGLDQKVKNAANVLSEVFQGIPEHMIIGSFSLANNSDGVRRVQDLDGVYLQKDQTLIDANLDKLTALGKIFIDQKGENKGYKKSEKNMVGACPVREFFIDTGLTGNNGEKILFDVEIFGEGVNQDGEHVGTMQMNNFSRNLTGLDTGNDQRLNIGDLESLEDLYVFTVLSELDPDTINAFAVNPDTKTKFWERIQKFHENFNAKILSGVIDIINKTKEKYLSKEFEPQCPEIIILLDNAQKTTAFLEEKRLELENFEKFVGEEDKLQTNQESNNTQERLSISDFVEFADNLKKSKKEIGLSYNRLSNANNLEEVAEIIGKVVIGFETAYMHKLALIRKNPEALHVYAMTSYVDRFIKPLAFKAINQMDEIGAFTNPQMAEVIEDHVDQLDNIVMKMLPHRMANQTIIL